MLWGVLFFGGGDAFYVPDTVLSAFMLPHYSHRNPSNAIERVLRHRDMKQPVEGHTAQKGSNSGHLVPGPTP